MNRWRYFDITHRDHLICNPTSLDKLDGLIDLLRIPANGRLLDIACGRAVFTCRVLRRYEATGVGVDLSPQFMAQAREQVRDAGQAQALELIELDGAAFDGEPHSFDATFCLGASWIWQGHRGTLSALAAWTKPGGVVLVGEPFWCQEPAPQYLDAIQSRRDEFATHAGNVEIGVDLGLIPLYATASNLDEWDRYETLQWQAAECWASDNPDDADRETVLDRLHAERDAYLRWGRDTLGWGLYLFRVP
jgi:SAM-dependent methyltransferase